MAVELEKQRMHKLHHDGVGKYGGRDKVGMPRHLFHTKTDLNYGKNTAPDYHEPKKEKKKRGVKKALS